MMIKKNQNNNWYADLYISYSGFYDFVSYTELINEIIYVFNYR